MYFNGATYVFFVVIKDMDDNIAFQSLVYTVIEHKENDIHDNWGIITNFWEFRGEIIFIDNIYASMIKDRFNNIDNILEHFI